MHVCRVADLSISQGSSQLKIRKQRHRNLRIPRTFLLLAFLFKALIIFSTGACAGDFQAKIFPDTVKPGDAFSVTVTGLESSCRLSGVFREKEILFGDFGDGSCIALAGVGLETTPGSYNVSVRAGRRKIDLEVSVTETTFPTTRITLPKDKVTLSPEDTERTARESARLKAIFSKITGKMWDGNFIMPLNNDISAAFGVRRIINRENISVHKGVDIRGREGDEIMASNDGKVVLAEELFFGGNTIILDHGQGIYTVYMHLSEAKAGTEDIVSKGEVIGLVGSTGRSTGPHLHFGVRFRDISVNPLSLISLEL
jgi:murein DD-endopeptidase MepM/ murein hydrolase activator NlpD